MSTRRTSRGRTTLLEAGTKAAIYGVRHLVHSFDYHLLRGLAAPDKVAMVLTHQCNCRCIMCDLWRTRGAANELPAERWIALLDELHSWTPTLRVRFVGGEVLLKAGVYDIIRRAVDLGFTVNLISNGLALQSERNYRDLMATGLRHITFSLDGKDAAIHDRNRGTPGLHDVVSEVIRRMKREKPAMCVSLVCILMRETVPQLAEYARWAEELGVDRIMFQPLSDNLGRPEKRMDWHRESDLFVRDLDTLRRSMDVLKQTAFGHVDNGPVRQSWRSERAGAVRRAIRECRQPCASMCNRSPGLLEKAATFLRYARAGTL
jgi:MoaA/NifB/PqqE/SkfB family radical SAM enzyme